MKKAVYIIVLVAITITCMIVGLNHNFNLAREPIVSLGKQEKEKSSLDSFSEIDLNVNVGDIDISVGDDFGIDYTSSAEMVPSYEVKDGVLVITQKKKKVGIAAFNKSGSKIKVTVPNKDSVQKIKAQLSVGNFRVHDLEMDQSAVTVNVGDLKFDNVTCKNIETEVNTGDMKFHDIAFNQMNAISNIGDVKVYLSKKVENCKKILSADVGDVVVFGEKHGKNYSEEAAGDCSMKIESNVGDVKVLYEGSEE